MKKENKNGGVLVTYTRHRHASTKLNYKGVIALGLINLLLLILIVSPINLYTYIIIKIILLIIIIVNYILLINYR